MKFTVSQDALSNALAVVSKGVSGTSTLPILSCVLIKAGDGLIELQTSNYTTSVRHRIAAHVEEEGELVVPCKLLTNIAKTLPDAPVHIESVDRQTVVSCEKSTFTLATLDPRDFPEFPAYAIEAHGHPLRDGRPRVARDDEGHRPPDPRGRAHHGGEQHAHPRRHGLHAPGHV